MLQLSRTAGCQDVRNVRPSLGPPRCKRSPPGRESQGLEASKRAGGGGSCVGTPRNAPYKSCSIVGRQHRRITHLAVLVEWAGPQASVYLAFLPGVHTLLHMYL